MTLLSYKWDTLAGLDLAGHFLPCQVAQADLSGPQEIPTLKA